MEVVAPTKGEKGVTLLTETIKVRCTPEEKQAVQEAASKEQRTMSDWGRLRLRTAAGLNGPVLKVKGESSK